MSQSIEPKTPASGGAWAAILAACIGCAAFGVLTDLSEASKVVSAFLNFYKPSGDLSGKTTIGIAIWLAAWGVLHVRWKNQELKNTGKVAFASVLLFVLALIATFPLFFGLFAPT